MSYNDTVEQAEFFKKFKIHNFSEPISLESIVNVKVLNTNNDWVRVEDEFAKNKITVVDNFLNPAFAFRLRQFMLFTNLRQDIYKDYAAINFFPAPDSIWIPILTNLVKECKETISFLKDLTFERAWSFIYTNNSGGVATHADPASVNINFWVTPEDCFNLKDDHNGLDIWPVVRPTGWEHKEYNGNPKKSQEFLESQGIPPVKINYAFNRVVIFDSSFFHKTQPISCKPGYENRRINYTLLYK